MGNLGDGNAAAGLNTVGVLSYLWGQSQVQPTTDADGRTSVFELDLNVKDGDDLALALRHIHVALNAHDLGDVCGDAVFLGRDLGELCGEVVLGPIARVLVDLIGGSENTVPMGGGPENQPSALLHD